MIQALRQRDSAVRQEEETHAAQAGQFASAPVFSYQVGPDGKRYAVGGEVSVRARNPSGDPEQARRALAVVQLAASSPVAPSAQDLIVARQAAGRAGAAEAKAFANLVSAISDQTDTSRAIGRRLDVTG